MNDDYDNLLIGGKHSRRQIDEAKNRVKIKREIRRLGGKGKFLNTDPTEKLERVLAKMVVKGRKY